MARDTVVRLRVFQRQDRLVRGQMWFQQHRLTLAFDRTESSNGELEAGAGIGVGGLSDSDVGKNMGISILRWMRLLSRVARGLLKCEDVTMFSCMIQYIAYAYPGPTIYIRPGAFGNPEQFNIKDAYLQLTVQPPSPPSSPTMTSELPSSGSFRLTLRGMPHAPKIRLYVLYGPDFERESIAFAQAVRNILHSGGFDVSTYSQMLGRCTIIAV